MEATTRCWRALCRKNINTTKPRKRASIRLTSFSDRLCHVALRGKLFKCIRVRRWSPSSSAIGASLKVRTNLTLRPVTLFSSMASQLSRYAVRMSRLSVSVFLFIYICDISCLVSNTIELKKKKKNRYPYSNEQNLIYEAWKLRIVWLKLNKRNLSF